MAVAGEQRAVAHVEVDVAIAVDVLEPGALGPAGDDGIGVVELERRRNTQRQHLGRRVGSLRLRRSRSVRLQLPLSDLAGPSSKGCPIAGGRGHRYHFPTDDPPAESPARPPAYVANLDRPGHSPSPSCRPTVYALPTFSPGPRIRRHPLSVSAPCRLATGSNARTSVNTPPATAPAPFPPLPSHYPLPTAACPLPRRDDIASRGDTCHLRAPRPDARHSDDGRGARRLAASVLRANLEPAPARASALSRRARGLSD